MRILVLLRAAPGAGKSTFIREQGLSQYALSADDIRLMASSPELKPDGTYQISQKNDKTVWKILFELLEKRMQRGEFTIIDATNSKTSEMNQYKKLADQYRYRIYLVDMTDIPIETCKERNANRLPEYKRVPDYVIDKMYARFETQGVPSGIKVIKPDELQDILDYRPIVLDDYEKVHVIGDVHGCATALKEYLKDGIKYDEYYIFTGDYTDRGVENDKVLELLCELYKEPNIVLLEGNHEKYVREFLNGQTCSSREFNQHTKPQIERAISEGRLKPKDLKQLYRKLNQICVFKYGDKEVIVSHAGIGKTDKKTAFIPTEQFIKGVGSYEEYEDCAKFFNEVCSVIEFYQINGHRNVNDLPVRVNDVCFNLEGKVEFGGCLRAVTLDRNGFETHEIKNDVYKVVEKVESTELLNNDEMIEVLRHNKYIKERKMNYVSSFNFTREAFYKSHWDGITTKARGLFIDTRDNSICARGYNKFFAIGEQPETEMNALHSTLKFPVTAYVKENGFLGLISYNKDKNDFMFCSKSCCDVVEDHGRYVDYLKNVFNAQVSELGRKNLLEFLRLNNVTVVCECVDIKNDPHIVEYKYNTLYLLDVIDNSYEFKKMPYDELVSFASHVDLIVKKKERVFEDWNEFNAWFTEVSKETGEYAERKFEGFVIEDAEGFMAKIKCHYYKFWKRMRGVVAEVYKKGYVKNTANLYDAESNYFYGWLRSHKDEFDKNTDIITLRKRFLEDGNHTK